MATDFPTFKSPFDPSADERVHEECGIFGIYGTKDAAAHTALGLHALQHRGQEAAGVVSYDGKHFNAHRSLGLVGDHFNSQDIIDQLRGDSAIGHNRYSTSGKETALRNVQPLFAELSMGGLAIAHNGNLTNALQLRRELVSSGSIFQSTSDTEVIVHLVATSLQPTMVDRMVDALQKIDGAYSLVALTENQLIGIRDPFGVRPLVMGKLSDGSVILASETVALDIIGAEFVRDIAPGEVIVIDEDGIQSFHPFRKAPSKFCIFEYVYFSRPDSLVEGKNVYELRKRMGQQLARESIPNADVVVPVPDSGVPAAIGYAAEAGLPFELGIIRNHYVGRTFIEPADHIRHLGVKLKHNANVGPVAGKNVVLIEDSIVRGTTSIKIVEMIRAAGAKEVHMLVAAPAIISPCYYGVDTPSTKELLAANMTVDEMARYIGLDSLGYMSMDAVYQAVSGMDRDDDAPQYCDACFTQEYAIPITDFENGKEPKQLSLLSEYV